MKSGGFILVTVMFVLLLLAVVALTVNQRLGEQVAMSANSAASMQQSFSAFAGVQNALWRLSVNPCWRTATNGEPFVDGGTTFTRTVAPASALKTVLPAGYADVVGIACVRADAAVGLRTFVRYWIYTVAGTGHGGYTGDGGAATNAQLNDPERMAVAADGTLYVAGTANNCVRRIGTNGVITTVAGTGNGGYSGDGGPATSARLNHPYGVCLTPDGGLLVADRDNQCIRKVSSSGIISTVAGTGSGGYSGDGWFATLAKLNHPCGVCCDTAGNYYIADTENNVIRMVGRVFNLIWTVAGTGTGGYSGDGGAATSARLNHPNAVCLTPDGGFLVADSNNHCIRKVSSNGIISTVAGTGSGGYSGDGGPATAAQLNTPWDVAVDGAGNVYIVDKPRNVVRRVNGSTGIIETLAGTGHGGYNGDNQPAVTAYLKNPGGIAFPSPRSGMLIYIADSDNDLARALSFAQVPEIY